MKQCKKHDRWHGSEGCYFCKSEERAPGGVATDCYADPPQDSAMPLDGPRYAERRLDRIRGRIRQAIAARKPELSATPESYYLRGRNFGATEGLKQALKIIEQEIAPAAVANVESQVIDAETLNRWNHEKRKWEEKTE